MKYSAAGISLVELLVSLVLAAFLSTICLHLLLQARLLLEADRDAARLQENGRYALRLLVRELEMAGFFAGAGIAASGGHELAGEGCARYLIEPRAALELLAQLDARGQGTPAHSLPSDCLLAGGMMAGSDALLVRRTLDHTLPAELAASSIKPDAMYVTSAANRARMVSGSTLHKALCGRKLRPPG